MARPDTDTTEPTHIRKLPFDETDATWRLLSSDPAFSAALGKAIRRTGGARRAVQAMLRELIGDPNDLINTCFATPGTQLAKARELNEGLHWGFTDGQFDALAEPTWPENEHQALVLLAIPDKLQALFREFLRLALEALEKAAKQDKLKFYESNFAQDAEVVGQIVPDAPVLAWITFDFMSMTPVEPLPTGVHPLIVTLLAIMHHPKWFVMQRKGCTTLPGIVVRSRELHLDDAVGDICGGGRYWAHEDSFANKRDVSEFVAQHKGDPDMVRFVEDEVLLVIGHPQSGIETNLWRRYSEISDRLDAFLTTSRRTTVRAIDPRQE